MVCSQVAGSMTPSPYSGGPTQASGSPWGRCRWTAGVPKPQGRQVGGTDTLEVVGGTIFLRSSLAPTSYKGV